MSLWDKKQIAIANNIDFFLLFSSFIGFFYCVVNVDTIPIKYQRMWLEISLLRVFTVILTNRTLVFSVVSVIPHFIALLSFAALFLFAWARLGVTCFSDKADVVISAIYDASTEAKFNDLQSSMLALIQVFIGEGWNEILYLNVLATSMTSAYYFIVFFIIETLFLSNIFTGLILDGIEELKQKRLNDDIIAKCMNAKEQDFYQSAFEMRDELQNEIREKQIQANIINTLLQIRNIKG